jgi:hypothetical protein
MMKVYTNMIFWAIFFFFSFVCNNKCKFFIAI